MGTPGSELHINSPELLSGRERTRDIVITAIMWSVYLYLWMPLISLFAWLFGFELAYDVMVRSGGAQHLGDVIRIYVLIIVAIFTTVSVWSLGNLVRYGKMNRRHSANPVSTDEMAEYFDLDSQIVEQLRLTSTVAIEFTDDGHPIVKRYEAITVGELADELLPAMLLRSPEGSDQAEGLPAMIHPGRSADSQ